MILILPPQNPPVVRDPSAAAQWADDPAHEQAVASLQAGDGVRASQSPCSHLKGPAQSLCYQALYGVSV
jgi:hypothetical protein